MKTAIIGSGVAGLATAIRLAHQGKSVTVYEANNYPGGKLTAFELGKYRFDAGPSLFTLPELVADLFRLVGKSPEEHFPYIKKDKSCHYFWNDGTQLTAWSDQDAFATEIEEQLGVPRKTTLAHLEQSATIYNSTKGIFLERSLHQWKNYFHKDVLLAVKNLPKLNLTKTLHQVNEDRLKHPKLVQLFNRYATYNGSDPYKTPGVMLIIPHLEHNIGTYLPKEGMHQITERLYALALEMGVTFHFNSPVDQIITKAGKAIGVQVNGEAKNYELVVSNMDIVPTYRKLLRQEKAPEKILEQPRSSSALIFYWGIKQAFPQLDLHNIFFSDDYKREFQAIFDEKTVVDDPTIYVNITSKDIPADAPTGCENWFVMINVPGDTGQDWDQLIAKARAWIILKLSRLLHADIEALIEEESILEPRTIASKTSSYQGSLYGASSNNTMAAFFRHANFTSNIDNLYFCGGSVHPGGGIPLCLLSAQIVSTIVNENHNVQKN